MRLLLGVLMVLLLGLLMDSAVRFAGAVAGNHCPQGGAAVDTAAGTAKTSVRLLLGLLLKVLLGLLVYC